MVAGLAMMTAVWAFTPLAWTWYVFVGAVTTCAIAGALSVVRPARAMTAALGDEPRRLLDARRRRAGHARRRRRGRVADAALARRSRGPSHLRRRRPGRRRGHALRPRVAHQGDGHRRLWRCATRSPARCRSTPGSPALRPACLRRRSRRRHGRRSAAARQRPAGPSAVPLAASAGRGGIRRGDRRRAARLPAPRPARSTPISGSCCSVRSSRRPGVSRSTRQFDAWRDQAVPDADVGFGPLRSSPARIAPTEVDTWRGRVLRGRGARRQCGGHRRRRRPRRTLRHGRRGRGVRALVPGVVARPRRRIGRCHRRQWRRASRREAPSAQLAGAGWDTMLPTSSCGSRLSARAIGHTGFTGTSLWIDPRARRSTSSCSPTACTRRRAGDGIRALRVAVHDAVAEGWPAERLRRCACGGS